MIFAGRAGRAAAAVPARPEFESLESPGWLWLTLLSSRLGGLAPWLTSLNMLNAGFPASRGFTKRKRAVLVGG